MKETLKKAGGELGHASRLLPAWGIIIYQGIEEENIYKLVGGSVLAGLMYLWSRSHNKKLMAKQE